MIYQPDPEFNFEDWQAQVTGKGNKKRKPLAEVASRGHFGQPQNSS